MSKALGFERHMNSDGADNPKYIDLLDEDKAVAGQKFSCISFISPEKNIKIEKYLLFRRVPKTLGFY